MFYNEKYTSKSKLVVERRNGNSPRALPRNAPKVPLLQMAQHGGLSVVVQEVDPVQGLLGHLHEW